MLKILYVFGGEKASGAEIVIKRLIDNNKNCKSFLILSPGDFANKILAEDQLGQIQTLDRLRKLNRSSSSALKYYFRAISNYLVISFIVLQKIVKHDINVVHANTIVPSSYLIPALCFSKVFLRKVKWIWSDHDLVYFSKLDNLFSKYCYRLYDLTLSVSIAVGNKYEKSSRNCVLYNGLDTNIYKKDYSLREIARKRLHLNESDIVIGLPATIAPRKGQIELINAFNNLINRNNVKLVFAGSYADDFPSYTNQFQALIDGENILHIGHINSMVEFYNMCDIVINNSSLKGSEPLGTTIYEAMSCEKVVAASLTGGSTEIVEDGVDGFLFEADSQNALQNCLQQLCSAINFTTIQGNARRKVIFKFNIKTMVSNYNSYLKKLISS